jgi:hypothetical protein
VTATSYFIENVGKRQERISSFLHDQIISRPCLTISMSACKIPHAQQTNSPAEIAQLVEHATENRGVVSSILTLGTLGQNIAGVVQW